MNTETCPKKENNSVQYSSPVVWYSKWIHSGLGLSVQQHPVLMSHNVIIFLHCIDYYSKLATTTSNFYSHQYKKPIMINNISASLPLVLVQWQSKVQFLLWIGRFCDLSHLTYINQCNLQTIERSLWRKHAAWFMPTAIHKINMVGLSA